MLTYWLLYPHVINWCLSVNITYILHFIYILNLFITSVISLTQAQVLLVIKSCQRCTVPSPASVIIQWAHETECPLCNSSFKGQSGDSCREMKKWIRSTQFNTRLLSLSSSFTSSSFASSFSFVCLFLFSLLSFFLLSHFISHYLSPSFQQRLISFSLNWISFPASPFPFCVCLSRKLIAPWG